MTEIEFEKTFVMIKPDGVMRGLVGDIIARFEKVGLKIVGLKFMHIDKDFSKKHYANIVDKPFYKSIEDFITSGPVIALILEGANAIKVVRKMSGPTEPSTAEPGTIRGDYAHMNYARGDRHKYGITNIIHASDSVETAEKEISMWFSKAEIYDNYKTVHEIFM